MGTRPAAEAEKVPGQSADATYPAEVQRNLEFLAEHRVWHIVSQNPPVRSCPDAAARRLRLGHEGIPLFDELKSALGVSESSVGRRYVAVHCRGHQRLDEEKLANLLGAPFRRLGTTELSETFSAHKGLVNPFGLARRGQIQQVFDESVVQRYFPPYTMMTNIGDLNYGVEFHAAEVIAALDAVIADVVEERGRRVPKEHKIGILTGNSPESGILLWEWINSRIRDHPKVFRGDFSFPTVFIESAPGMGLSMELAMRESAVRPIVLDGVNRLCLSGATVIGIACNTTQYFAREISDLCHKHGAQFVSTADETALYLRREQIESFDFLGIGAVSDFGNWSGYGPALRDFNATIPSEASRSKIDELAYYVKKEGVTGKTVTLLRDLIQAAKSDVVVLALTELSIVYASQKKTRKSQKRVIDTLEILANRMANICVQEYLAVLEGIEQDKESDSTQS